MTYAHGGSFDNPDLTHFPSVESFLSAFESKGVRPSLGGGSWSNYETGADAFRRAREGSLAAVPDAEAILADINADLDMSGLVPRWGRSVVGPFPDVPAFLAGEPQCMYRKEQTRGRSGRTPVSIYFCPTTSAGVSGPQCFRRGVVMLAAAMALSRVRPVRLYYFTTMGTRDHVVRLQTDPMVLSEAAHVMTSVALMRCVSFAWATDAGWGGEWGKWACQTRPQRKWTKERKVEHLRKCLGAGPEDIILPSMHLNESYGIMADPAGWINSLLDVYRQ